MSEPAPEGREAWRVPRGRTPAVRVDADRGAVLVRLGASDWYAFDGEGRLLFASCWGRRFRRSLEGRLVEQPLGAASLAEFFQGRRSTALPARGALVFQAGVYHRLRLNAKALAAASARAGPWSAVPGGPGAWLDRALAWDASRLQVEGDRFRSVYAHMGALPPDQERAVVLQPTLGCRHNACTFCDTHRLEDYRLRTPDEFREHLLGVRAFFGAGLAGRRWLFCGTGNALAMPTTALSRVLRDAAGVFRLAPAALRGAALGRWLAVHPGAFEGFSGFLDERSAVRRAGGGLRALRGLGLRRVYLGLETGCEPLREALRKPGTAEMVRLAVAALHAAGIDVGVTVLLGVGGRAHSASHVRHTARLLAGMELGVHDFVHLSPLVVQPGTAYRRWAAAETIEPLSPREMAQQYEALSQAVQRFGGPRVCLYPVENALY